jgi:hypothetical protein
MSDHLVFIMAFPNLRRAEQHAAAALSAVVSRDRVRFITFPDQLQGLRRGLILWAAPDVRWKHDDWTDGDVAEFNIMLKSRDYQVRDLTLEAWQEQQAKGARV